MSSRPAILAIFLISLFLPRVVLSADPVPTADAEPLAPTLGRVTFVVPPERMTEFEVACEKEFLPLLEKYGIVLSALKGRATVDSVFSQLLEFASPEELTKKARSLRNDPEAKEILKRLDTAFGSSQPDSLIPVNFGVYSTPGLPGKVFKAGPGKTKAIHKGTGRWHTYSVMDGLPSGSVISIYQDREGFLWFGTWAGVSRFDGQRFTNYTRKDGLASNNIVAIH
jgi:hypothetical protein